MSGLRIRVAVAYMRLGALLPMAILSSLLALLPFHTCVWRLALGIPCPACGFTRASLRLLHGDLYGSFLLHPMAIPAFAGFPIALGLALALRDGHPGWSRFQTIVLGMGIAGFGVVWVLRLAGVLPPV